jgi:serine/threonine-protein kinase
LWKFVGTLWKTPRNGGPSIHLADARDYWGGDWEGNDSFLYVRDTGSGIYRVAASGGTPEQVTQVDTAAGEVSHRFPVVLPGDKGLLYSVKLGNGANDWRIVARSFATPAETVTLVEGGMDGRYAGSGHLVYGSGGSLYAAPMDLDPIRITGSAVRVVDGVIGSAQQGAVAYSFSDDGTLVYVPLSSLKALETHLRWVDRDGGRGLLSPDRHNFVHPRLSPNGSSLAVTVIEGDGWDVRVYDLDRGVESRLTTEGDNQLPLWTPDGRRIVFQSNRSGNFDLWWTPADGSGRAEALTDDVVADAPSSVAPDGTLAFTRHERTMDIWILKLGSGEKPTPFLATEEDEANAAFSPDGKWIAYEVVQGDRAEIFVQPFTAGGRRSKISIQGGASPVWSRASRELFYMEDGKRMMAVTYELVSGELNPGPPRPLFEAPTRVTSWAASLFDVTPDARRFVMPEAADLASVKVVMVQNWFAELERLVPRGR